MRVLLIIIVQSTLITEILGNVPLCNGNGGDCITELRIEQHEIIFATDFIYILATK